MRREVRLPSTPVAPGVARAALDDVIPPPELAARSEHARLVVSEIVTNAVRYGSHPERDDIVVLIEADELSLRVQVDQALAAAGIRAMRPDPQRIGGFGLYLTEALADSWGYEPGPPGSVWFEFKRTAEKDSALGN
jgi:anti-sigma regulatory factor (Ser/Thr protein kinase)